MLTDFSCRSTSAVTISDMMIIVKNCPDSSLSAFVHPGYSFAFEAALDVGLIALFLFFEGFKKVETPELSFWANCGVDTPEYSR